MTDRPIPDAGKRLSPIEQAARDAEADAHMERWRRIREAERALDSYEPLLRWSRTGRRPRCIHGGDYWSCVWCNKQLRDVLRDETWVEEVREYRRREAHYAGLHADTPDARCLLCKVGK
ncbi:MAG TPA: hypothetical protein VNL18_12490 [Gemmatimonadales bacterium]|nr:hypothetical protein [Gemmatimonadales bacterium]